MAAQQLTAKGEDSVVEAHVLLDLVCLKCYYSLEDMLGGLKYEHFLFRKTHSAGLNQLSEMVVKFAFLK